MSNLDELRKRIKKHLEDASPFAPEAVYLPQAAVGLVSQLQKIATHQLAKNGIFNSSLSTPLDTICKTFGVIDLYGKGTVYDLCDTLECLIPLLDGDLQDLAKQSLEDIKKATGEDTTDQDASASTAVGGWGEADAFWLHVVRPINAFKSDSINTAPLANGVTAIAGKLAESDETAVHALRFSKTSFEAVEDAKAWVKDNPEVFKAVWSTEFINNLPDASFAYIKSGGEKDDEGKTTPRSLRYLPHHNADVTDPNDDESVKSAVVKIDLQGKELYQFQEALENALTEYAHESGAMGPISTDPYDRKVWPRYIFEEYIIWRNHMNGKLYRVDYSRDSDGNFTFASAQEVEEQQLFVPVKESASKSETFKADVAIQKHWSKTVKDEAGNAVEHRFILGGVLQPNDGKGGDFDPDKQGDVYSADDIEQTAWGWAMKGFKLGVHHLREAGSEMSVVESHIVRSERGETIEGVHFAKGTWVLGAKVNSDELWKKVKDGELKAWSIEGIGVRLPLE